MLQQAPENSINKVLLEKKHAESIDLNLRKFILIDSQSTMDLLFNENILESICKSKKLMILRSNGVKMVIDHKAVVAGYIKNVWFDKNAITDIFSLKNMIQ